MQTTRRQQILALRRMYVEETGETAIDLEKFTPWINKKGVPLPKPRDPMKMLEAEVAQVFREEVRYDKKTRLPYRANHAVPMGITQHGQSYVWIDIDDAPRKPMLKALQRRREGIVDDAVALELDAEHWSNANPNDQPIVVQMDFTLDVEIRKKSQPRRGRTA